MKKLSVVLGLLIVMGLSGIAMGQEDGDFEPWIGLRGSYQATFETDLFGVGSDAEAEAYFRVPRARVGVEGSFAKDLYFQVEFDGRNTSRGRGVDLRVAFVRWDFLKSDSMLMQLEAGAITTAFARPLSGTEYAFINYDICTVLDAYQYGLQYRGAFADKFIELILSANNGEGVGSLNIGSGLQYVGRLEITPLGGDIKDITDGNAGKSFDNTLSKPMLSIGLAGAFDNKARTDDFGYTVEYFSSYHALADLTFKVAGLSFFAQGVYNMYNILEDGTYWGGADNNAKESYGGFAQIGFNLKNVLGIELEPMGKFEWWNDVIDEGYGADDYNRMQFAAGLTYYVKGHDLKLNIEFRHVLNDDKSYAVKPPWENYLGFRMTHKFATAKDTAPKPR